MIHDIFSLERLWCWERLRAGGEGDNRGWDGWMASPTRWTWVWVNSGSWWWTGKPGVLWSMGVAKSWAGLSDWTELDCSPPGSSVHGILLAGILENLGAWGPLWGEGAAGLWTCWWPWSSATWEGGHDAHPWNNTSDQVQKIHVKVQKDLTCFPAWGNLSSGLSLACFLAVLYMEIEAEMAHTHLDSNF